MELVYYLSDTDTPTHCLHRAPDA